MSDRVSVRELGRYEGAGELWADAQPFGAVDYELRELQEVRVTDGVPTPAGPAVLWGSLRLQEGHPFPLRKAQVLILELEDGRQRGLLLAGTLSPGQPLLVKSSGDWIAPTP